MLYQINAGICYKYMYPTTDFNKTSMETLPPWQQNILSSIMAATGRQLKQSVNVFHSFWL